MKKVTIKVSDWKEVRKSNIVMPDGEKLEITIIEPTYMEVLSNDKTKV